LTEAELMRRLLPEDEYAGWLAAFLPRLGAEDDPLLAVPRVLDAADGHAVHLHGLALSRAWQLRRLAAYLPDDRGRRVLAAADAQVASAEHQISDGHLMATHWLVSFALLAEDASG
jgi:hypothetical protein